MTGLDRFKARLRGKFARRDRMAENLRGLDAEIDRDVRTLAAEIGAAFLRVESARLMVSEGQGERASG